MRLEIPVYLAGWGGRIRTSEWRDQNPLPYHLATPQLGKTKIDELAFAQVRSLSSKGESFIPRAMNPANAFGTFRKISRPRSTVSQAKKTQAPVPVRRADPKSDSQSSACATSGYRRRTTPKQSFLPPDARKP